MRKILASFLVITVYFFSPNITWASIIEIDNFDAYTFPGTLTGNSNANISWDGNVAYIISQTQATSSTNSVAIATGGDLQITGTLATPITSKTITISIFSTNVARDSLVIFRESTSNKGSIGMQGGQPVMNYNGAQDDLGSVANSEWFMYHIALDCSADTISARVNGGAYTAARAMQNSGCTTNIDNIMLQSDPSASTIYYDTLGDDTPPAPPAASPKVPAIIIIE